MSDQRIRITLESRDPDYDTEILFALGAESVSTGDSSLIVIAAADAADLIRAEYGPRIRSDELISVNEIAMRWAEGFTGARITESTAVTVPGQASDAPYVIVLEPDMSFGSGTHPTTRLCLTFAEELLAAGGIISVLDIGCGTGILAIAACCYGAKRVVGYDIDPAAVEAARRNAALSGVSSEFLAADVFSFDGGEYDLVLANLHTALIERCLHRIAGNMAIGGRMVLSGIMDIWRAEAEKCIADAGLTVVERRESDGWLAYLVRRQN